MGVLVNRKQAQYATSGFYAKRCNPDGTMAHGQRTLGFIGAIDIVSVLDSSNTAKMQIKVGTGPWQVKVVDFSSANPGALTVTAAATALTAAAFSGCTFNADTETGRLILKASDAGQTEIQVYGYLAGALNFGGCRPFEGMGCYYVDYITQDDTVSIQPAVQKDDNERIEQEGSHGTKTALIIAGGRNGEDLAVTAKPLDFELQQMVQGGKYRQATVTGPAEYEPPLPGDPAVAGNPLMTVVKVDPLYAPNVESLEGQEIAVKTALYYAMIGSVGDESGGAKSLTQFTYNFSCGVYTDENGELHSNPLHRSYTSSQWEAFNLKALLERPLDDAA
jgi:hypothetical protein